MIYIIDEITDTGCIDLFIDLFLVLILFIICYLLILFLLILFVDNDVMFFVRGEDLWSGTINFVVEE